jgi:hypothetical protein
MHSLPRPSLTALSVMAGLVPAIHAAPFLASRKRPDVFATWMTGTSPVITALFMRTGCPVSRDSLVAARLPLTLRKKHSPAPAERTAESTIGGRFGLLETAPDRIRRESTLILWKVEP